MNKIAAERGMQDDDADYDYDLRHVNNAYDEHPYDGHPKTKEIMLDEIDSIPGINPLL